MPTVSSLEHRDPGGQSFGLRKRPTICYLANARSTHTAKWVNHFAAKNYEVHLISFDDGQNIAAAVHMHKLTSAWKSDFRYFAARTKVRRLLSEIQPHILHAHYAGGYGTLGGLSGFHPYIISVWGDDVYVFPRKSFMHRKLLKWNLAVADRVCSTSHVMASETRRYCSRPIIVTPFGVDCQMFKPASQPQNDSREVIIGTVRSLEEKYGIAYLLKSFSQIAEEYRGRKRLKLEIGGDGSLKHQLLNLAKDLGIEEQTRFLGPIPHDKVPEVLRTFSIFVAVSVRHGESFGVAVVEASATGLPVVVSRIGGLPEVVRDGVTGIIVPPRDVATTAAAIRRLIESDELRHNMGAAGREFVLKNYEWTENARRMERLYESILSGQGRVSSEIQANLNSSKEYSHV